MYQYNDQVSFELPEGYIHRTVDDANGNTRNEICYGKGEDASGNETWEFRANIILGTSDSLEGYTREKNENILDFYKRGLENSRFSKGLTAPETAVFAIKRPVRVFGMLLKFKVDGIIAVIDQDNLLVLQAACQQDDDDPDPEIETFRHLMRVGNSIRINGKAMNFTPPDPKKLVKELKFSFDEENDESSVNVGIGVKVKNADGEETDAGTISISGKDEEGKKKVTAKKTGEKKKRAFVPIEQEGTRLVFGGNWSMDLVSNCRLVRDPLDDESTGKQYAVKSGTREIWKFIIADEKDNQTVKSAVSEISQGVMERLHDAQSIIDLELRADDRLKVTLHVSISGSGFSCAMVKVETPDGNTYTLTSILPHIEDVGEALKKINSGNLGIFHPFGSGWEAQWTLMMRMVASIRSLDDPEAEGESWVLGGYEYALNPEEEIIPGVRCRIPKNAIKTGENTYALMDLGLDGKQQVTGKNVLRISFVHAETEDPFDRQSDEPHNRLMVTHLGKGFASVLREKRTEGFHACLGYVPLGNGNFIISLKKDRLIGRILIECGELEGHPMQYEAIACAGKLFDSLTCGSMLEDVPSVFPPTPDFMHEHYDLVESGSYTTHRDADFTGQSIRMLLEKHGNEGEEAYELMEISGDTYSLDRNAVSLAKVFRLDSSLFDPYGDTEALIRKGMFKDARSFEALRSLAWTVSCMADRSGRAIGDYTFEELEKIGKLIEEQNNLNYTAFSYMPGLCDHYDWHVFYVPEEYLRSDYQKSNDLRYLTGKENRGGNSTTIVFSGLAGFGNMNRVNDLIGRNEETLESLEALRYDLEALLPVMETIHDGLLDGRDRTEKPEGPLADALTAWCALAIAAREPFYSEEAASTYEADAGLDGPLERPTDRLDDKPVKSSVSGKAPSGAKKAASKPAVKKAPPRPSGDVLDLGGETVIKAGQFTGNMALKNIIIPEGVTEIGERAFYSCMFLESVVFPKSLRKIGQFAFMSCRALKKVDLQEGVEELETHVFGATNNLTEVHLPDSLKKVDRLVFGIGGDSPYATAYLSGKLAKQLYDVSGDDFKDIYARHIIIDGKPYESIKAYLNTNPTRSSYTGTNPSTSDRDEAEARKVIEQANEVLSDMQNEMTVTKAALERHAEIRSKQEAEKEKNKAAARARGRSDKDEADMLAVLLIEEDQGNLYRDDDDFVKVFSEDFGAYNENQMKQLRNKIRPKIHDAGFLEEAKEEMLSRPVKDRFSISTANWFNLSPDWNFDEKGETAIQKTRLWYRENELGVVRQLMETHKRDTRRNVGNQLNAYNSGWDNFNTVRNDLQIEIWQSNDPVPPQHSLYDVQIAPNLKVKIVLKSPSMGMLVIQLMNVFTSVWNVTPEQIWDAALRNELADARGVSRQSLTDARNAKAKALAQIRKTEAVSHSNRETPVQQSGDKESIRKEIQRLENEKASLTGLFAFVKRAKIQKQIDDLYEQLKG